MLALVFFLHALHQHPLAAVTAQLESDDDPTVTECVDRRARTSRRHHDDPAYATPTAPCHCGLYQTTATSPAMCLQQRDPDAAVRAWLAQRQAWRSACRGARHLELCTVAGYAVGWAGVDAAMGRGGGRRGRHGVRYARALLAKAVVRREEKR